MTCAVGGGIIYSMKKLITFLLVCVLPSVAGAYINRETAVLRVMDKDAGKVQEIVVPVGQTAAVDKLTINIRACMQSDPFDAENFWAFVEISDSDDKLIFSNWFNRNEPGQKPLQHPDYDVWLVKCE